MERTTNAPTMSLSVTVIRDCSNTEFGTCEYWLCCIHNLSIKIPHASSGIPSPSSRIQQNQTTSSSPPGIQHYLLPLVPLLLTSWYYTVIHRHHPHLATLHNRSISSYWLVAVQSFVLLAEFVGVLGTTQYYNVCFTR
ncbi:uncharacterized protein EDB93DRAFT_19356 [Suillus bovinus]|uniref:uncharacterized protein n=1 Tax=Suillus bovinus TaxID=48563 RepID=UPI001B87440D|nr:uncharacterized protein EDB93DRAFT_19356 [Suillus bovinus]KAG2159829.1 hypothetical protein EDB93DRAFT_19356 [Suillus bovinus]